MLTSEGLATLTSFSVKSVKFCLKITVFDQLHRISKNKNTAIARYIFVSMYHCT
jgi:hypothetical protein